MLVKKVRKIRNASTTITKESSLKGASSPITTITNGASYSSNSSKREEEERTTLDMTGWEEKFDYSSMKGLFFIQKGQFIKKGLCVTVRNGNEYDERYIGGYDPSNEDTEEHYCVIDKVTFHTIFGGRNLDDALKCLTNCIVRYNNNPEKYFEQVCEVTNEDFYGRHYKGYGRSSDATLKRRAEEGRSWKTSEPMKRQGYAIYNTYGWYFDEVIEDAEEKAMRLIEEKKAERRNKRKESKLKRVKNKRLIKKK